MNEQNFKANGFIRAANGEWYKPKRIGVGGLVADKPKQNQRRTLEPESKAPQGGGRGVGRISRPLIRITLIRFGGKAMDSDNFIGGCKPIRDAIAASLGLDDADSWIDWEYSQVRTRGRRGTIVKMEMI